VLLWLRRSVRVFPYACDGERGDTLLQTRSGSGISQVDLEEKDDIALVNGETSVQEYTLNVFIDDIAELEDEAMRKKMKGAVAANGWTMEFVDSMGEPETIVTDIKGKVKRPDDVLAHDFPLMMKITYRQHVASKLLQLHDGPKGDAINVCPHTNVNSYKWIGTAPFCGAAESDCADIGWSFDHSSKSGGGASCWTGIKVLCKTTRIGVKDECNPECNGKFLVEIVGTSPACDATECDCLLRTPPMIPYRTGDHDGSVNNPCSDRGNWRGEATKPCYKTPMTSGLHVVCLAPKANVLNSSVSKGLGEAVAACAEQCASVKKMDDKKNDMLQGALKTAMSAAAAALR